MQDREENITALYKTEYKKLYNAAYRMTGDGELAMDMVQDTFLLALSHLQELAAHPKPEAWLMTTLQNLVKNERRRFSNSEISLNEMMEELSPEPARSLMELLPSELTEDEKKVLIWRYEEGQAYREIAEQLGISETGSRSRVFRIIAKCKRYLKRPEDE